MLRNNKCNNNRGKYQSDGAQSRSKGDLNQEDAAELIRWLHRVGQKKRWVLMKGDD